ncbi:MAG TPA: hypothetical protein VFB27_00710 [Opitutaceae bacterium]|nr:hypothetical protein [Opitutaceae bacterium]
MKKILALLALAAALWLVFHESPARWTGMPAPKDPVQTAGNLPPPFRHGEYLVTPLATYSITAIVLHRERYRYDTGAELSPVDLALGWGPMSIASVLNELSISQSGRWYEYSWNHDPPLDPDSIAKHSANTHCLPADADVRRQLLAVHCHDLVMMEGYLVEVTRADGYHWRSSLTRDDTGGGSCEVMWITQISRRKP